MSGADELNWSRYRALREQWTHEDNLINHRITWLILSQGLLLTAYCVLLQSSTAPAAPSEAVRLVQWVPWAGIGLSVAISVGIIAAINAMDDVKDRYNSEFPSKPFPLFPDKSHIFSGALPAKLLPLFFIGLWVVALVVNYTSRSGR